MINPIGGIFLVFWIVRAIRGRKSGGSSGQRAGTVLSSSSLIPLGMLCAAYFVAMPCVFALCSTSPVLGILTGVLAAPFFLPWSFVRWCFVPLGWTGPASFFSRWCAWAWRTDLVGGGVASGTWALLRKRQHDPAWGDLQEQKLWKSPLRGGGVLAHGLLAASRGDVEAARQLLASVSYLNPRINPVLARKLAREWLMADAAGRGDWKAVFLLGQQKGPRTMVSRLLYGQAARTLGEEYPFAGLRLVTAWLLSFRWPSAWPLLRQALQAGSTGSGARPQSAPKVRFDDSLLLAMTFHAEVLRTPPGALTATRLLAAGHAWDAALRDPALEERLAKRSVALAQLGAEDSIPKLRSTIVDDLVATLREARIPLEKWKGQSEILESVASVLRNEMLQEVEQASSQLQQRVKAERALPVIDEWREFLVVRNHYERAAAFGGPEVRRMAFNEAYYPVSALSVWLYNKRHEKPVGNAMILWLLAESKAVGDQDAIRLQAKNAALGVGAV